MRFYRIYALLPLILTGCGYTLQTSASPEMERVGIRRIFVRPLENNSYKSGVENLVYNALLKALSGNRAISLVSKPEEADAILGGTVNNASFTSSAQIAGDQLKPTGAGSRFSSIAVSTEYSGSLSCSFRLLRRNPGPGKPAGVWSADFSRSKLFPGSNQLGILGETSALINESEFDRSLADMAQSMMADVRESMLSRF